MKRFVAALAVIALATALSETDKTRMIESLNVPLDSLKTAYQVTVSRSTLKQLLTESTCGYVAKNTKVNLEDLYYASFISKIQGCPVNIAGIEDFLRSEIKSEGVSTKTIFKAASALHNFDLPLDEGLLEILTAALEKDDSVMSHSLIYLTASLLPGDAPKDLIDSIEDVAHRADTIGDAMSFDGGLIETAMFLKGAFALSVKGGNSTLSGPMAQKFTNYVLSNKNKVGLSNLFYVLMSLDALSNNGLTIPTRVQVLDNSAILSNERPILRVALVNPLGEPVSGSKMFITSAASPVTGEHVFSSGEMAAENKAFEVTAPGLKRGIYNIEVSTEVPAGYLAPENLSFNVKVIMPVKFTDAIFKLIDIDDNRVIINNDLSMTPIKAKGDLSTRLVLDFYISDGSENVALHQVFARFANIKTKQQVYFIAQADLTRKYTVDVNLRIASAKNFGSVAGDYSIEIIAGDATLPKTEVWNIVTLTLDLPESKEFIEDITRSAKPEISHIFREQEKRPPQTVSMFFTGLVLLPAVVLLLVWIKLGANLSNYFFSFSGLAFHLGLLSIFAIYINFFLGVNMFTTMKCLSVVAVITFIAGQRLLSSIAVQKKVK